MADPQPDTPRDLGDTDAPHMSPVKPDEDARTILLNRVSWAAVLAGVVAMLVTQLILNMLGIGVGAATLDPGTGDNPSVRSVSIGAGIWYALSGIIASFVGGYAAGRLCGRPKESTAGWHGLTAWALTTLVIFYLLTSTLGSVAGGLYSGLSSAVGGLGRTATTTAQTTMGAAAPALSQAADPFGAIERQVREATGGNDPAALRDAAISAVRAALTGDQARAQQARDQAAQTLARAANIPVEEARNRVQQYEQQYRQAAEQARQQAVEAGRTAARTASRAALWGSIALSLGALAAWFGGRAGAVHPTITAAALSYARRRV
jgi:hypothetical protein